MNVATALRHSEHTSPAERPSGPCAGRVLIVNSPSFGAVSLSLAWTNEGAFAFTADQPPTRSVRLGGGWYRESRWGAAVAVSLPDGVHVFDAMEIKVALHAADVALEYRQPVEVYAGLFLAGLARLGVEEVRRIAADWSAVELASAREEITVATWRKEMRRVWGSDKRRSRAYLVSLSLTDAVMGDAKLAA